MYILSNFSSPYYFISFILGAMLMSLTIVAMSKYNISKNNESRNNVHFYVARNKNGELWLYIGKPKRGYDTFFFCSSDAVMYLGHGDTLKMYGLNEHDYDSLKWEDEPIEVFINLED